MATRKGEETLTAVLEVLPELTEGEERERHRLELKVDRAVGEAWLALKQLRDNRLYRNTHKSFEEYAKDRFGFNRAHAYRLISAAQVLENLSPNGRHDEPETEMSPNGRHLLPKSERLCRELAKLPPPQQSIAWEQVLELSTDKAPTAKVVKDVVERFGQKPLRLAQDFCEVGDVFLLQGLVEAERKYNGCWAIASDITGVTVGVEVHDGSLRVKPDNLKPIDSPEVHRSLPVVLKRIKRLRECGMLDRCAYTVLESLGRQTYLTDLEEKMLSYLEEYYQVKF